MSSTGISESKTATNQTLHEAKYKSSPTYYQKNQLFYTITKNIQSYYHITHKYANLKHKQFSLSVQEQTSGSLDIGKQLLTEPLKYLVTKYNNLTIT